MPGNAEFRIATGSGRRYTGSVMLRLTLLFACALLAACTVERAQAEVELDIFSGRPNPTWILTDAEADSFIKRSDGVVRSSGADAPGHLGYRGFIVRITRGADIRVTRIPAGTGDRELERWLLNTGKPHLTNELFQIVERELRALPEEPAPNSVIP
jgi:hypothetical protein